MALCIRCKVNPVFSHQKIKTGKLCASCGLKNLVTFVDEEKDMTDSEKCSFVQNAEELASRGLVAFPGPCDNHTDCESDVVITHIPTEARKRFHGTFYDQGHIDAMYEWIIPYEKVAQSLVEIILKVKNAQRKSSYFYG